MQWDNQLLSEGILHIGTCHIEWGHVTAVNTTEKQQFKRWFVNPPIVMITPSSYGGVFTTGYVWGKTNVDFSVYFSGGEDRVTFDYIAIGY